MTRQECSLLALSMPGAKHQMGRRLAVAPDGASPAFFTFFIFHFSICILHFYSRIRAPRGGGYPPVRYHAFRREAWYYRGTIMVPSWY